MNAQDKHFSLFCWGSYHEKFKFPNIENRSETMKNLIIKVNAEGQSFKNLIEEQKKNGTYANETFIAYTPVFLGIPIRILRIPKESVKSENGSAQKGKRTVQKKNGSVQEENKEKVQDLIFPAILAQPGDSDKMYNLCIAHYNEHFQSVIEVEPRK
jgi:hypothetical protein